MVMITPKRLRKFLFQTGAIRSGEYRVDGIANPNCFYSKLVRLEVLAFGVGFVAGLVMFLFQTGAIRRYGSR